MAPLKKSLMPTFAFFLSVLGFGLDKTVLDFQSAGRLEAWTDKTIPLPHKIAVEKAIGVRPEAIVFSSSVDNPPMSKQVRAFAKGASENLPIRIVAGLNAEKVRGLKNTDQAYVIESTYGTDTARIDLYAATPTGLYYAARTLSRMVNYKGEAKVLVPLVNIVDWPEIAERGPWNSGLKTVDGIPYLAELKLNFEHVDHPISFALNAETCPPLPRDIISLAKPYGFHVLFHTKHFDFFPEYGMEKRYLEAVGQGDTARNPSSVKCPTYHQRARCPCASNPSLQKILVDWMLGAAQQGERDVSLWLTEYQPCRCSCEKCATGGEHQLVKETRQSVAAIAEVRKQYPDFTGRVFMTFNIKSPAEEKACRNALSLIPADGSVKVECVYYFQAPFDDFARSGGWVTNYCGNEPLGIDGASHGAFRLLFAKDPKAFHSRLKYLSDAKYSGVRVPTAFMTGGNERGTLMKHLYDYHLAMLAEWTWNPDGRDVQEFNRAWFVRQGYADPDAAVRWLDVVAPLEATVLTAMKSLASPRSVDVEKHLDIADPRKFAELTQAAKRSVALAREIRAPELERESRYLAAALEALRGVYLARSAKSDPEREMAMEQTRAGIDKAIAAAAAQTAAWKLPPTAAEQMDKLTADYWKNWEKTVRQITDKD